MHSMCRLEYQGRRLRLQTRRQGEFVSRWGSRAVARRDVAPRKRDAAGRAVGYTSSAAPHAAAWCCPRTPATFRSPCDGHVMSWRSCDASLRRGASARPLADRFACPGARGAPVPPESQPRRRGSMAHIPATCRIRSSRSRLAHCARSPSVRMIQTRCPRARTSRATVSASSGAAFSAAVVVVSP